MDNIMFGVFIDQAQLPLVDDRTRKVRNARGRQRRWSHVGTRRFKSSLSSIHLVYDATPGVWHEY